MYTFQLKSNMRFPTDQNSTKNGAPFMKPRLIALYVLFSKLLVFQNARNMYPLLRRNADHIHAGFESTEIDRRTIL